MSPCAQHLFFFLFFSTCLLTTLYITFCRGRHETPKRGCGIFNFGKGMTSAEIRAKES